MIIIKHVDVALWRNMPGKQTPYFEKSPFFFQFHGLKLSTSTKNRVYLPDARNQVHNEYEK